MITDVDAIEAALADAGWRAGAEALVAGWVDHRNAELGWEETWAPDDRCRHILKCPGGERLVIEWTSGDTWELSILWPEGWGREHVRMGWRESLEEVAEDIARAEGPFGGSQYPDISTCDAPTSVILTIQAGEDSPPPPAPVHAIPLPADVSTTTRLEVQEPPDPAGQIEPRYALAPDASPEDIQRHFADVEAAIPPRLTGAATAVELWDAIRQAHKHRALPITGNWVDLVAELHRRGFLPHLPGDRASRAALLTLAKLSPLVRRLHHRRWALGAGS